MRDYFSSAYFLLETFLALQTRFTVRYCKKVKMGVRGIYRLMMLIMSVAIVAFAAIAYVNWVAMREENAERDMVRQKLFDHVQKLKADKEYKTQYFYRLLHDEKFAERIIREKLGFVGKDEIVFRFEDSNPVGVEIAAGNKPEAASENSGGDSLEDLAEDFKQRQLYGSEPRESLLSRMMFWRHETSPSSSGANSPGGGSPEDSVPEIKIDMLEQSADKNMAAAKEAQKRDEENATVQVNFSFGSASGGHGEESKDASAGKIFGESDFTASQRPSGELIPSNSNKTSAIKIGRGSYNSKVSKHSGGIKKIRFQSN